MRIVVAVKILPDSKDLRAGNDGALDFSQDVYKRQEDNLLC